MEIRIVEVPKKVEKVETPLVLGGVYRNNDGNTYLLTKDISPVDGEHPYRFIYFDAAGRALGCYAATEEQIRWHLRVFTYIPGAYLAIPKEEE